MGVLDALWHVSGFLAPAVFMALVIPIFSCIFKRKWPAAKAFIAQSAILFVVSTAVLSIGLVLTGKDGKMATYAALLIAAALAQLWNERKS